VMLGSKFLFRAVSGDVVSAEALNNQSIALKCAHRAQFTDET
jgi:hypothetical protein